MSDSQAYRMLFAACIYMLFVFGSASRWSGLAMMLMIVALWKLNTPCRRAGFKCALEVGINQSPNLGRPMLAHAVLFLQPSHKIIIVKGHDLYQCK